jgi:hypothetical protein
MLTVQCDSNPCCIWITLRTGRDCTWLLGNRNMFVDFTHVLNLSNILYKWRVNNRSHSQACKVLLAIVKKFSVLLHKYVDNQTLFCSVKTQRLLNIYLWSLLPKSLSQEWYLSMRFSSLHSELISYSHVHFAWFFPTCNSCFFHCTECPVINLRISSSTTVCLYSRTATFYVWFSVHHNSVLYKEPTRCNFGSIVY